MTSYQYIKFHCGDKTVVRSSYLHNGISYTGKMTSLYWIRAQKGWKLLRTSFLILCLFIGGFEGPRLLLGIFLSFQYAPVADTKYLLTNICEIRPIISVKQVIKLTEAWKSIGHVKNEVFFQMCFYLNPIPQNFVTRSVPGLHKKWVSID